MATTSGGGKYIKKFNNILKCAKKAGKAEIIPYMSTF